MEPIFGDFGARVAFAGEISTVTCFEDNSLVRAALSSEGRGRVLVVDGGGSLRCALIGDQLVALAVENGWAGAIVNGCVRDVAEIATIAVGVKALAAHPRRSNKQGVGERDVTVRFAGVTFTPGDYVYGDDDGIVVSSKTLTE